MCQVRLEQRSRMPNRVINHQNQCFYMVDVFHTSGIKLNFEEYWELSELNRLWSPTIEARINHNFKVLGKDIQDDMFFSDTTAKTVIEI